MKRIYLRRGKERKQFVIVKPPYPKIGEEFTFLGHAFKLERIKDVPGIKFRRKGTTPVRP